MYLVLWGRNMRNPARVLLAFGIVTSLHAEVLAGDHFWSGDWNLTLGGAGISAPSYEGADDRKLSFQPIISLGRQGAGPRFSSRNDSASIGLLETDAVRAGVAGRLIMKRDEDTSKDLEGLSEVKMGGELGGFVDVYPTDFLRLRGEARQGIRSHDGVVADVSADAFTDIAPDIQLSGGPRARYATSGYSKAYYGVNAAESAASGYSEYDPDGGWQSVGAGAALTWSATDRLSTSAFAEYKRLVGPAGESSLVQEGGSKNQVLVGVSASYKFGFSLD